MRLPLVLAIAACGYPPLDGNGSGPDGGMPPHGDGSGSGGCQAPSSYGSASFSQQEGDFFPGSGSNVDELDYYGNLNATDVFSFVLFDGNNIFNDSIGPATVTLSGQPADFSSCAACVLIATQCGASCDPSTGANVGSYYFANGGTLNITSANPNITGTMSNVTFVHVTVNFTSGAATPVGDGCETKIASGSFNGAVTSH